MKQCFIWNVYVVGVVFGFVLLLIFVFIGYGLGVFGVFMVIVVVIFNVVVLLVIEVNGYFGWMVENGCNLLDIWIIWEVVGVVIGVLVVVWWLG